MEGHNPNQATQINIVYTAYADYEPVSVFFDRIYLNYTFISGIAQQKTGEDFSPVLVSVSDSLDKRFSFQVSAEKP